jgi:hypothetical protein
MLDSKYTQHFSAGTINNLEKYGNCNIVKVSIGKHDILNKFLRYSVLNILSNGLWSKELIKRTNNKLKHTYIICTIKDETDQEIVIVLSKEFSFICKTYKDWLKELVHKEETIQLSSFNPNINITINILLEQTIQNMGDEQFLIWTPISSCQEFTKSILVTIDAFSYKYVLLNKQSNIRIYDETANNFIIQNIENIFTIMPRRLHVCFDIYILAMKKLYGFDIHY